MIMGNVRPSASGSSRRPRVRAGARAALVLWAVSALSSMCACTPLPREAASVGSANRGFLWRGVALPDSGPGYLRARPGEDTRWGAPLLRDALVRAASAVARVWPGGAPLVIGDLSARHGGAHSRHGSHQSGRDADVLFFLLDAGGRSIRGSGFYAFDEFGASAVSAPGAPVHGLALFDTARNWAFVRALLLDEEAPVEWIFCANGIKARLLHYAAQNEPDARALVRAAYVLHQPSYGNPHRDHFHVRIACTAEERARGCVDEGPVWPWIRLAHEKPAREGRGDDDVALLEALLGDLRR